jgi:virulence factor Mce-like protein
MIADVRDRLTEGFNRERLLLETRRALPSIPTILVGVIVTVVLGGLILSQLNPTLFKATREARFAIDDAYGVLEGVDQVRYRGVPAGTIRKIDRQGTQLVLRVSLRKDFPVYKDARAELRPQTPLNDMFLDIVQPGSRAAGELGDDVLPEARTSTAVKINDVLNALESNERTRLGQLIDNLGNGLADRGDALRAAIHEFAPFVRSAAPIADALAERETITKRLVHNAGVLTTELGRRERQLRTLVREGGATLGALQAGSGDLDSTLRQLPPTFSEINASFAALRAVLDDVDTAVSDLGPVADRLPTSLRTVRGLNRALAPAVARLQSPVRRLVPLATALRPVAGDVDATMQALRPQLDSVGKITTSLAKCEDAVIHFFQWNASLSKFGDIRGPIPRGNLAVNAPDVGVPGVKKRKPAENCAGGVTIDGRVPRTEDEG